MGRTNPTFRMQLRAIRREWDAYRRALRYADQAHFDRLFEHADAHADAAGHLNPTEPLPPILVSMLLEHEKRLARLEARVEANDRDAGSGPEPQAATDGDAL